MTPHPLGTRQDQLLDIGEVTSRLSISKPFCRTLVRSGILTPIRLGQNVLRFRESEIDAIVSGEKQAAILPGTKPRQAPTGRPRGRPPMIRATRVSTVADDNEV